HRAARSGVHARAADESRLGAAGAEPRPHGRRAHQKPARQAARDPRRHRSDRHAPRQRLLAARGSVKLGVLLFAAYLAIVGLCFAYPLTVIGDRMRTVYLESAEEPLVDAANVLAELLGQQAERGALDVDALYALFDRVAARAPNAQIYEITKRNIDL